MKNTLLICITSHHIQFNKRKISYFALNLRVCKFRLSVKYESWSKPVLSVIYDNIVNDIVTYFHSNFCRAVLIFLTVLVIVAVSTNIVSGCPCPNPEPFFLNCFGDCSSEDDCTECRGTCEGCQCAG